MENTIQIHVQEQRDLAKTRQVTRKFLHEINASLHEQARISWLTHNLARHILMIERHGDMQLGVICQEGKTGITITCEGWWLRGIGEFYEKRIFPVVERTDEVIFREMVDPCLKITIWLTEDDKPEGDEDNGSERTTS